MAKVKTAISIDQSLFSEAEKLAVKMGVSRSELFSRAVAKLVRDEESWEMLARLDETHADSLDKEEREYLRRMKEYQAARLKRMEEEGEL
ncbi:MAG: hypothetical protein ACR2KW_00595 [Rubrobacter sp.]